MLTPFLLAALCLLAGAPLAVLLARSRATRTPFALAAVESLLLGLIWYLLLGVVLAHRHDLGRVQLLVPTLVLDGIVLGLLALRPVRAWRGGIDRPRVTPLAGFLTVAFVVGAALRTEPAYFLYQIGDFGEYVNRGNVLADGGDFSKWFTHGFSVLLALAHVVVGEAREVEAMSFLGLLVMATVLAVATRMGVGALARGVVGVALTIGLVPVWYSSFPASETFYAALLSGMLLLLVTAVQDRHDITAVIAGVVAFCLMLTRGNAVLLIPLLLGFAVLAAPFVDRATCRTVTTFVASSSVGLFAGFVYNSRFSHPYFITFQMPQFFPDSVWRRFDDLGGLKAAAWKGAIFGAVVVVVLLAVERLNVRLSAVDSEVTARARAALLPAILAVAVLALFWPLDAGGLREGLEAFDAGTQALVLLGLAGAVAVFARALPAHVRVGVLFAALLAVTYALVHAYRFPEPRTAPYFIYWERYLWSELLPMALVLAGVGVALLLERWGRLTRGRAVAGALLAIAAAAGTWSMWSAGELAREHRFMGDAYGSVAAIDELTGGLPIVYHGLSRPDALTQPVLHPNTFRLFAQPLFETFGREVLNIEGIAVYGDDPQPTPDQAVSILRRAGEDRGAFVQVRLAGEPLSSPVLRTRGEVEVVIPMLDSPRWEQPTAWRFARYLVTVSEVSAPRP